jgi:hypothetical protein
MIQRKTREIGKEVDHPVLHIVRVLLRINENKTERPENGTVPLLQ